MKFICNESCGENLVAKINLLRQLCAEILHTMTQIKQIRLFLLINFLSKRKLHNCTLSFIYCRLLMQRNKEPKAFYWMQKTWHFWEIQPHLRQQSANNHRKWLAVSLMTNPATKLLLWIVRVRAVPAHRVSGIFYNFFILS